jgi:hypothetical protein
MTVLAQLKNLEAGSGHRQKPRRSRLLRYLMRVGLWLYCYGAGDLFLAGTEQATIHTGARKTQQYPTRSMCR